MDDADVRRLRVARGHDARFRHLLQEGQTGLSVAFDMPDPDGLRPGPPAVRGRGRLRGRLGRLGRRHVARLRRHRPGRGLDVADDLRAGAGRARDVRRGGRAGGRAPGAPARHRPGRHPQGVHRPEGVGGAGTAGDAADRRPDRLLHRRDAAVVPGVDQRLPHARGGGDGHPGAGLHARRRPRVRRAPRRARDGFRPLPAALLVLLQRPRGPVRGRRQGPRRPAPVGHADARAGRRTRPALVAAAHARPDLRCLAHGPAAAAQRGPRGHRGARRRALSAPRASTPPRTTRRSRSPRPSRRPSRCARSR